MCLFLRIYISTEMLQYLPHVTCRTLCTSLQWLTFKYCISGNIVATFTGLIERFLALLLLSIITMQISRGCNLSSLMFPRAQSVSAYVKGNFSACDWLVCSNQLVTSTESSSLLMPTTLMTLVKPVTGCWYVKRMEKGSGKVKKGPFSH